MTDLLFGNACLIVGVEDDPGGWLKVYLGARYKNIYCVVTNPEDQERVKKAWGSTAMHVTMPLPDPSELFNDEHPYDPNEGANEVSPRTEEARHE